MIEFGKWLAEEMGRREIQQKQLANAVGVDAKSVHNWINESDNARIYNVQDVLCYLGYELRIVKKGSVNDTRGKITAGHTAPGK